MDTHPEVAATIACYDLVAEAYERRNSRPGGSFDQFRDTFISALDRRGRIADLGCGPGRDAKEFQRAGMAVVGVDASMQMARRARAHGVGVVIGDLRNVPLPEARLDGLWSSASLLHVPREEVPATLRSWVRCLCHSGILGLCTSLGTSDGWEWSPYKAEQPPETPPRRWFVHHERANLISMLQAAGLQIISAQEQVSRRHWLMVLARSR